MSGFSETREVAQETSKLNENISVLTAYNRIPYALINNEVDGSTSEIFTEFKQIANFYSIYKRGIKFTAEGTGGHYVAAQLRYKKIATLINKEARFLFSSTPDVIIEAVDVGKVTKEAKAQLATLQDLVNKVLEKNMFESILLKGAKDCFIGKRVALMANFNEDYGVTLQFIPALNFVYETRFDNSEVLIKFVSFVVVKDRKNLAEKRIFKKKFVLETETDEETGEAKDVCYLEEAIYDGAGKEIEVLTEYQPTLLDRIPVAIVINDGLTGETYGESEVEALKDYEQWYSKLSSADIDAGRKGMNGIKYTVDMTHTSTKNLSTSPGAYWDLQSDQNLDKPAPSVGILESSMNYSGALDTTLKRIRASMYEEVDVPDITLENIQGIVTSGKAMKCLYWPLIVRCNEKMKVWGPAIKYIIDVIIRGALVYPNCIRKYTGDIINPVDYEINIVQNYPLPEDEQEEKEMDLAEVAQNAMSRKSYMKKWRNLTDHEVEEELQQLAYEASLLEGINIEGSETPSDAYLGQEGRETDLVTGETLEGQETKMQA